MRGGAAYPSAEANTGLQSPTATLPRACPQITTGQTDSTIFYRLARPKGARHREVSALIELELRVIAKGVDRPFCHKAQRMVDDHRSLAPETPKSSS